MEFVLAAGVAFGAIFLAEFGDKSQLLVLAFATRYPAGPVIAGVILAAGLIQGASVLIGAAVGAAMPDQLVSILAGIAFVAVAAWTLRGGDEDTKPEPGALAPPGRRLVGVAVALTVAGAFMLSELGDKTMLATFALAASQGPLATWIGSTAGEVAANLVAVVVGQQLGDRLSPRLVRIGSATLFAVAGVVVLAGAFL